MSVEPFRAHDWISVTGEECDWILKKLTVIYTSEESDETDRQMALSFMHALGRSPLIEDRSKADKVKLRQEAEQTGDT